MSLRLQPRKIPPRTTCFQRPQREAACNLFESLEHSRGVGAGGGGLEFAWIASVHSGARLNPVSTACYYNGALSMHKGPLLLFNGTSRWRMQHSVCQPRHFTVLFLHRNTHTHTTPLHLPLKSRPCWPSLMPLIRLSIALEETRR